MDRHLRGLIELDDLRYALSRECEDRLDWLENQERPRYAGEHPIAAGRRACSVGLNGLLLAAAVLGALVPRLF